MSLYLGLLLLVLVVVIVLVVLALIMQVPSYPEDIQKLRARSALTESLESLAASHQEMRDGNGQHRDDGETRDLSGYRNDG